MEFSRMLAAVVLGLLLGLVPEAYAGPVDELSRKQAEAKNGYIRINDNIFSQMNRDLRSGKFSAFLFFDVIGHEQMPRDYMEPWMDEFNVASRSYELHRATSSADGKHRVFFCYMDFSDSEKTFTHLNVQGLPHIVFLSSDTGDKGESCDIQSMNGRAESMLECLRTLSGLPVGKVHRTRTWKELIATPLAVSGVFIFLFAAWRMIVLTKRTAHMPILDLLICTASILIYGVSISGTMYTIINNMPWFHLKAGPGEESLVLVLRGDEQLGAEGLGFGTLYTLAGITLAFVVNVVPTVSSKFAQRLLAYFCLASSAMCMYVVYYYQEWKRT